MSKCTKDAENVYYLSWWYTLGPGTDTCRQENLSKFYRLIPVSTHLCFHFDSTFNKHNCVTCVIVHWEWDAVSSPFLIAALLLFSVQIWCTHPSLHMPFKNGGKCRNGGNCRMEENAGNGGKFKKNALNSRALSVLSPTVSAKVSLVGCCPARWIARPPATGQVSGSILAPAPWGRLS